MPSFLAGRLRAPSASPSVTAGGGACCCAGGVGAGAGSSCWGRIGRRVPRMGRENSLTVVIHLPSWGKETWLKGRDPNPSEVPDKRGRVKGFVIDKVGGRLGRQPIRIVNNPARKGSGIRGILHCPGERRGVSPTCERARLVDTSGLRPRARQQTVKAGLPLF